MKIKTGPLTIIVILVFIMAGWQNLQPQSANDKEGFSFTWQDLRKILGLGDDKIKMSWQEFRQLLIQTGTTIDLDFKLQNGVVTLNRDQFKRILARMKPVLTRIPRSPQPYLITEAVYNGSRGDKSCQFSATFKLYLFQQQKPGYVAIPLLPQAAAIADIRVDGRPAVVRTKRGWYQANLLGAGHHTITISFSISHSRNQLHMPIIKATTNRITFTIPEKDLLITSPGSVLATVENGSKNTQYTSFIPSAGSLRLAWKTRREERLKKPALFYAKTTTLLSVAAEVVKARTTIQLQVLQSSLEQISVLLPQHYEMIRMDSVAKNNWLVRDTPIGRVLEIHPGYEVERNGRFTLHLERSITAETLGVGFTGIKVLDARRQSGTIGLVADSSVEVEVQEKQHLDKLEYHQVPKTILAMSSLPILNCFKYSQHPYQLDFTIQKHKRLPGISTIIESARATLLLLEDGKVMHQISYRVKNSYKQFMELQLPEGARIWTVLVDNKPEKASKNSGGKILIPLVRSGGRGDQLQSFPVDLVYSIPAQQFAIKGKTQCHLPKSNIFVNKMDLQIYLPRGFSYSFDKGEWKERALAEKQVAKRNLKKFAYLAKPLEDKDSEAEELNIDEKEVAKTEGRGRSKGDSLRRTQGNKPAAAGKREAGEWQVDGMDASSLDVTGPAGLNSVRVHLPLSGSQFSFVKKVIDANEAFPLTISFVRTQLKTATIIGIAAILLTLSFLIVIRKFRKG